MNPDTIHSDMNPRERSAGNPATETDSSAGNPALTPADEQLLLDVEEAKAAFEATAKGREKLKIAATLEGAIEQWVALNRDLTRLNCARMAVFRLLLAVPEQPDTLSPWVLEFGRDLHWAETDEQIIALGEMARIGMGFGWGRMERAILGAALDLLTGAEAGR